MNRRTGPDVMPVARSEAIQPSLWDRLVNDLPGLEAEIESQRRQLAKELGGDDALTGLLDDSKRNATIEEADEDTNRLLYLLRANMQRRNRLQTSGIAVTRDVLREAVRRDIETLFNIERMEAQTMMTDREARMIETPADLLADFPHVRASVINYGVPSFAGRSGSDFDKTALARELRDVLIAYEPRLKPNTIKVKIDLNDKTGMKVTVDAVLMLSPTPERLKLSTTIDLDTGSAATVLEDA
ncbi:type VI secretion system baseplate subunit TssE [Cognatiyoonia sp. IB215446]|uniref:type VI secretion system baseplate subunit TssE n=1 Tax=Cognatiyoonia sp. IB215446 TaxID=3097355 RepID=UPI002A0EFD16|nr:type VI secretion system baseplate subunit TssE [Cognatiyoonia sp. IB215446]MDX8346604.1 type VI secretion system baseplate subunit TssE [Cognatiyoonia sp. IB215446]